MITLQEAKLAKMRFSKILRPEIAMIGITKRADDYAIYIGLYKAEDLANFPESFDGVPIVADVVGEIKPL